MNLPLKVWVCRASNRRSIDGETDAPVPPCEGAELLAADPSGQAFYVMTFYDLGHLMAFIEGSKDADGGPCQHVVLGKVHRMHAEDMKALGVNPPDWVLTIYDDYLE